MNAQNVKTVFERTKKGDDLLKIIKLLEKFRKDYPKDVSRALEFVGIYDDKAVMRILKRRIK